MKKIILLLVLTLLSTTFYAQKKSKIKGNRNVTTVSNQINKQFNAIEVADELKVTLVPGIKNSYTLTSDKNLQDVIHFEVNQGTLKISTSSTISSSKKLEIMLTYENLDQITLKDNAQIKGEGILKSNALLINADNSSKFELEADTKDASIILLGGVKGKLKLKCDNIKIVMSDKSNLNADISSKRMTVELTKSANLELRGSCDDVSLKGSDSSEMDAKKMKTSSVDLNTSGSTKVHVDVNKNLQIYAKDRSSIYLYSEPKIDIQKLADKSEILKR